MRACEGNRKVLAFDLAKAGAAVDATSEVYLSANRNSVSAAAH
jgi:hypothetical protein